MVKDLQQVLERDMNNLPKNHSQKGGLTLKSGSMPMMPRLEPVKSARFSCPHNKKCDRCKKLPFQKSQVPSSQCERTSVCATISCKDCTRDRLGRVLEKCAKCKDCLIDTCPACTTCTICINSVQNVQACKVMEHCTMPNDKVVDLKRLQA